MTNSSGSPRTGSRNQSTADVDTQIGLGQTTPTSKMTRLSVGEQAHLRSLIQGPVAAMTAEHLSIDLDDGLEHDPRYQPAISAVRQIAAQPTRHLRDLLQCLDQALPAATPLPLKVLVIEAVARQLGRDWTDDFSSFVDVSIVTARLQNMADALAADAAKHNSAIDPPFVALLLSENEQHSLMCHLTGALFQTFGWQHQILRHGDVDDQLFQDTVSRSDVICIAWSDTRETVAVARLIQYIKNCTIKKKIPMIAGGFAAQHSVEFLIEMGIDSICDNAYSAVKVADNFKKIEKVFSLSHLADLDADKRNMRAHRRTL